MTIVGYSLNDTIVIFDRIRENMRGGLKGRKFPELVNSSINQTLQNHKYLRNFYSLCGFSSLYSGQ